MHALGERKCFISMAISLGLVGIVYLIFAKLMQTPLPRGVAIFRELSYYLY
jgi:hypothetical protein